jgi:Flp pilus assembly pilin Flp
LTIRGGTFIIACHRYREELMLQILRRLRDDEQGQDIAEYAVMLAVILLLVVGTIKLIGTNANNTFSNVASTLQ